MNCTKFNNCFDRKFNTLEYPNDKKSLYARRVNDRQTAMRRAYEKNPINIVEGFEDCPIRAMIKNIIKIALLVVVIYLIYLIIKSFSREIIEIGVDTLTAIAPITEPNL